LPSSPAPLSSQPARRSRNRQDLRPSLSPRTNDNGEWTFHRPVVTPWDFKASGKVIWVVTTGDDANDGSADKPFRTIGKAIEAVAPGDVIYVRAGTYVESIVIKKSGEEGKPIILSCAPGDLGKVKITPPKEYVQKNPSGAVIRVHSAQHIWINGLVVEGPMGRPEAPETEMYGANGITFAGKAGLGCRVTNCVVYWNVHCGIKEMGHGGTKILMEGNVIFDNGTRSTDHGIYCPADDLTIKGNVIFNNAGFGIHSYSSPKRQLITRNICVGNKAAGIILAGSDNKVFHNVCVNNGLGIMYFRGGCTGNIVKNNIFAFNKTDCAYDNGGGKYGDPAKNLDDFNCYFPGKPNERIKPGLNEVLAGPLFVDSKKGDFRLKDGSPCRGKGVDVGMGKAPDLGAFVK
jgi:parallel beta-helix repeat protein